MEEIKKISETVLEKTTTEVETFDKSILEEEKIQLEKQIEIIKKFLINSKEVTDYMINEIPFQLKKKITDEEEKLNLFTNKLNEINQLLTYF